jgi:hypothetical protein
MKRFTCTFAQGKVTHQRLRVGSKNPTLAAHPARPNTPPRGKAAAVFTRGAYVEYVSTRKWRERRWRLFSTDPLSPLVAVGYDIRVCKGGGS